MLPTRSLPLALLLLLLPMWVLRKRWLLLWWPLLLPLVLHIGMLAIWLLLLPLLLSG